MLHTVDPAVLGDLSPKGCLSALSLCHLSQFHWIMQSDSAVYSRSDVINDVHVMLTHVCVLVATETVLQTLPLHPRLH